MADTNSAGLRTFSAPYIESASALFEIGHGVKHLLFYRNGDASFKLPPNDIFAAGNFSEVHCSWSAIKCEDDYGLAQEKFSQLCDTGCALAGYVSYEFGYGFEQRWRHLQRPHEGYAWRFLQVNCWYEADHLHKTGTVYATADCPEKEVRVLLATISECGEKRLNLPRSNQVQIALERLSEFGELSYTDYEQRLKQILSDIMSGRYYELNFTQRFQVQVSRHPSEVYLHLFHSYCPRRGFYCDFGDEVTGSCSPELFLKKQGKQICTRPIKGSLAMDTPPGEQEKLHAEHIMVVDLARNDIGRICNSGWVGVPELATISSLGSLRHLESLVVGESSLTLPEILPHTFPAASITGAPKVEVVRAIAEYENSNRGLYTGSCGWIWPNGDFDLNVAIRTFMAEKHGKSWNYTIGAGGAIVADSTAEREYIECLQKVQPLISELLRNE